MSPFEESVYRHIVENGASAASEISRGLKARPHELRVSLHSLEAKGLISPRAGRPTRYVAAPPELAIDVLILQRHEALERARLTAVELTEKFRDSAASDPPEFVETVGGRDAYAQRFLQLQRSATVEFLSFNTPPYVTTTAACSEQAMTGLERGLSYRTIYSRSAIEAEGLASIRAYVLAGEKARVLPELPVKLAIADRRMAILPLSMASGRETGVVIHASPLLDALITLFETLWSHATPVGLDGSAPDAARNAFQVADIDHQLLVLLASGMRDQAVARQLGLGVTTVQRRLTRIMETIGARTRFQAGLQLARRGWISAPEDE